ncbi:methyl-accepting chemotaxis protein [Brevundimonas sp. PAMC22021]|uniref:methyl-accepting chemotaxis protein n=1 Tax=Brevundimonas sp. PAMC22021 TaxID=2861285 RepID=UPI001C62D42A|nr:methyl-accepting chemotaxis protein [Brevundimonas sp. PAMC22021]QYF86775.1 methyl-accepting chemotaxis protein [Brevundimonas sp. PAMC22021]
MLRSLSLATKTALMVVAALTLLTLALLAVAAVLLTRDAEAQARDRQEANMRVAWQVLNQHGGNYSLKNGALLAGDQPLNGHFEPVDRIKTLVGGVATVFMGDERISTNVTKEDGSRAVGTRLKAGPVHDAVLRDGRSYRGEAEVLETPYFVAYDPIKDASGKVVGVLFVGIPQSDYMASVNAVLTAFIVVGLLAAAMTAGACLWASRRMFAPLGALCERLEALQRGRTDVEAPWASRGDDIGQISRAVLAFRDAAIRNARSEAEAERMRETARAGRIASEAEQARIAEEDAAVVAALGRGLSALAEGDLTHRILADFAPRSRQLKDDYNAAVVAMGETVAEIAALGEAMRSGTAEVSSATGDLSRRTERQAAALEETAAALDEITATVRRTAEGAQAAAAITTAARDGADDRQRIIADTAAAMAGIEAASSRINEIIGVINEIAFQTNLLALNAGVEAARAGDAGRGFAVVASEVRALAQRSADAAKEIRTLIGESGASIEEGARLAALAGAALATLNDHVGEIDVLAADIAASAREQAMGLGEVNTAVGQMDQTTQQNAAMVEQTTAANQSLSLEAERLASLLGRFRLEAAPAFARAA